MKTPASVHTFARLLALLCLVSATRLHAVGLDVTSVTTLSAGLYSYDYVHVYSGATLTVDSSSGAAVTLTVAGAFTVDAGGLVYGVGKGYGADFGPGYGGNTAGAGHAGSGGNGYLNVGGGTYDNPADPDQPGSGGGSASTNGGAGGAALVIYAAGQGTLNGSVDVSGAQGATFTAYYGGGGGSGGSFNLHASSISGNGTLLAKGAAGNAGSQGGGGGGGGGFINLCSTGWAFAGSSDVSGGAAGSGAAASGGNAGLVSFCGVLGGPSPTITTTSTISPTFSQTPSFSVSPTFTPTQTTSPTPTVTPTYTPYGPLDVTGSLTLNEGTYGYTSVQVHSGGILTVNGAVTLLVSAGNFQVDAGGTVDGVGRGYRPCSGPGAANCAYWGVGGATAGTELIPRPDFRKGQPTIHLPIQPNRAAVAPRVTTIIRGVREEPPSSFAWHRARPLWTAPLPWTAHPACWTAGIPRAAEPAAASTSRRQPSRGPAASWPGEAMAAPLTPRA